MNIVLTGFMASGKSTVGKQLAQECKMKFIDTDLLTEQKAGMSVSKIFEAFGEETFRKMETEAVREVSQLDGFVIATGGGVVLRAENIAMLRENGIIVNLAPTEDVFKLRLSPSDKSRPLANGSSWEKLLEKLHSRQPYYDNCDLKITITPQMSIIDTAEKILNALEEKYESYFWCGRQQ